MKKRLLFSFCCLALLLSGCLPEWGDGLLQAPQLPGDYLSLQNHINGLLGGGAVQVSPLEGDYRNPVQLIDLDSDGTDEVLAFFRDAAGAADFTVYLFCKTDGEYTLSGTLSGHGLGVRSIYYPRRLANGALAVAVCWDMGEGMNDVMTLGVFENGGLTAGPPIEYGDIFISSLADGNVNEIVAVLRDGASGRYHARVYPFEGGQLGDPVSSPLSAGVLGVSRIAQGKTSDGVSALFVDEIASGKGYVTDVLTLADGGLRNLTLDSTSGMSILTYRSVSVPCASFGSSGACLIPTAYPLPGYSEQSTDSQWRLVWSGIDSSGVCTPALDTYYNRSEGWYLIWPESWGDRVTVLRSASGTKSSTTFLLCGADEQDRTPFFSIHVVDTGEKEDTPPAGYVRIGASRDSTYYYSLSAEEGLPKDCQLTDEQVRGLFRIIPQDSPPA